MTSNEAAPKLVEAASVVLVRSLLAGQSLEPENREDLPP